MNSDVTIIIRSVGERTEQLCKKLILQQNLSEEQIFIIREVPFSASMRKSFQVGIEQERKWTYCIDADVLLRPDSIGTMVNEFEKLPENVCEIQGLVIDKFFGGPRSAGNHLYRTSLLPKIIKQIPEEGKDIRPEYYTLEKMAKEGYPWLSIPYIIGTHDDEQYNADIYRKCFVQGQKHLNLAHVLVPIWKRHLNRDHDFQVALKGFSDSIIFTGDIFIDVRQKAYKEGFKSTGFNEKSSLTNNSFSPMTIENIILSYREEPEYLAQFPSRFGLSNQQPDKSNISLIPKNMNNIPSINKKINSWSNLLGKTLIYLGQKLKR